MKTYTHINAGGRYKLLGDAAHTMDHHPNGTVVVLCLVADRTIPRDRRDFELYFKETRIEKENTKVVGSR